MVPDVLQIETFQPSERRTSEKFRETWPLLFTSRDLTVLFLSYSIYTL